MILFYQFMMRCSTSVRGELHIPRGISFIWNKYSSHSNGSSDIYLFFSLSFAAGKRKCRNSTNLPTIKWLGWVFCLFLFALWWPDYSYCIWRHFSRRRNLFNLKSTKTHCSCLLLFVYNFLTIQRKHWTFLWLMSDRK